jgi:hypothetical protein
MSTGSSTVNRHDQWARFGEGPACPSRRNSSDELRQLAPLAGQSLTFKRPTKLARPTRHRNSRSELLYEVGCQHRHSM